jgi:hypothetical protein
LIFRLLPALSGCFRQGNNVYKSLILVFSLPRLYFLFRRKSEEELRYFEVTPAQRWLMAGMYFGLIALLVPGMEMTRIARESLQ